MNNDETAAVSNAPWDSVNDFIKVWNAALSGEWSWGQNTDCKYVDLRVDMRDGACIIKDRHGRRISPDALSYQYKHASVLAKQEDAEEGVLEQVQDEVARATRKFPTWPTDPLHALAVLGEEFGELTKAMLQHTYEPHKNVTHQDIREEAIQTAAMALRMAMSLERYRYAPCHQHSQSEIPRTARVASEGDQYVGMTIAELEQRIEAGQ